MKIWEVHGLRLDGAIRSTPDGEADVAGLVFSEKGYLLAVRDFRPHELVTMIRREGEAATISRLLAHYASDESVVSAGGRKLVAVRGGSMAPGPVLRRNDEVPEMAGRP